MISILDLILRILGEGRRFEGRGMKGIGMGGFLEGRGEEWVERKVVV